MLILNDVHLGFHRTGGTTPASREAARHYLFTAFEEILTNCSESHLLILGDLFDEFEIAGRDWLWTYLILQDWLVHGGNRRLTLVAGNHDWSPKATKVSSFELLCRVLKEQFGDELVTVVNIDEFAEVEPGVVALAHCSNQDLFEQKITEIVAMWRGEDTHLLLHANYDNNFATQSDHSLNVSADQAGLLVDNDFRLYFAHEHQARTALGSYVTVFGNQWPTSVSDCLNNDAKFAHVLRDGQLTKIETWKEQGSFAVINWRNLAEYEGEDQFVRIEGNASSNEAGDCLSAIAKFRTKSAAFVITNAVKIEGVADNEALPESFEATKAFDVMEFINSNLDERQQTAVKKLQEARQ